MSASFPLETARQWVDQVGHFPDEIVWARDASISRSEFADMLDRLIELEGYVGDGYGARDAVETFLGGEPHRHELARELRRLAERFDLRAGEERSWRGSAMKLARIQCDEAERRRAAAEDELAAYLSDPPWPQQVAGLLAEVERLRGRLDTAMRLVECPEGAGPDENGGADEPAERGIHEELMDRLRELGLPADLLPEAARAVDIYREAWFERMHKDNAGAEATEPEDPADGLLLLNPHPDPRITEFAKGLAEEGRRHGFDMRMGGRDGFGVTVERVSVEPYCWELTEVRSYPGGTVEHPPWRQPYEPPTITRLAVDPRVTRAKAAVREDGPHADENLTECGGHLLAVLAAYDLLRETADRMAASIPEASQGDPVVTVSFSGMSDAWWANPVIRVTNDGLFHRVDVP